MPIKLSEPIVVRTERVFDIVFYPHVEIHTEPKPNGGIDMRLAFHEVAASSETGEIHEPSRKVRHNIDLLALAYELPEVGAAIEAVIAALPKIAERYDNPA